MQGLCSLVGILLMYYDFHTMPLRAHHGMECFFATTGDLPIPTTFWGGARARSYVPARPGRMAGHSYPKSWLPQITWNTARMRA